MSNLQIAALAVSFFLGQFLYENRRRLGQGWEVQAVEGESRYRVWWSLMASAGMLAGISVGIFGVIYWSWWKTPILWLVAALPGGIFALNFRRLEVETRIAIERGGYAVAIAIAAILWAGLLR